MNLLAIDTAAEDCSVAVAAGTGTLVLLSETLGRGHAERLVGMIAEAMRAAGLAFPDLGRIAVTVGPGSFTGVRVGIAAARGLALVIGCPVAGIGSLDVLAENARTIAGAKPVMALIDARRGEVYGQLFVADGKPVAPPAAAPPAHFAGMVQDGMLLAGSGAGLVVAAGGIGPERIVHRRSSPDVAGLVRLGLAAPEPRGAPRPLYLRAPDAKPQLGAAVARL